ncbi:MAG: glycosyltransferase family A protein [Nitrospira sp.]
MPVPRVSVIIPTWNRESFVVKAIDSVLDQSFTDFEVIVIDDGSTDDTRRDLQKYINSIRYIYQENAGVSAARNAGIRLAQGEWVAFLDSDDEWTKDYLSAQVAQIAEFPNAVAHITNAVTLTPGGGRSSLFVETGLSEKFKANQCLVSQRPLQIVVEHAPWFLQSLIIRWDVLLEAGLFDPELSIAEDLDVIARVSLRGTFTFCIKELVEIYRRDESIEHLGAQSLKQGIYRSNAFGKVYANLLSSPGLSLIEKSAVANALSCTKRALGNILVMAGRKAEARLLYKQSFFLYPSVKSLIKIAGTFLPSMVSRFLVRKGRLSGNSVGTTLCHDRP